MTKLCLKCDATKPISEFYANGKSPCKACRAQSQREWHAKNGRAMQLKIRYGMTLEQYDDKVREQEGKCAICGCEPERLQVDHDHKCCPEHGKSCGNCLRGLLCFSCNQKLGYLENVEWLKAAEDYLDKHG